QSSQKTVAPGGGHGMPKSAQGPSSGQQLHVPGRAVGVGVHTTKLPCSSTQSSATRNVGVGVGGAVNVGGGVPVGVGAGDTWSSSPQPTNRNRQATNRTPRQRRGSISNPTGTNRISPRSVLLVGDYPTACWRVSNKKLPRTRWKRHSVTHCARTSGSASRTAPILQSLPLRRPRSARSG